MDNSVVLFFNQFSGQSRFFDSVIIFLAHYFPYLAIVGFLFFIFQNRHAFYERCVLLGEGIGAGIIARIFVEIFRLFIHRPRPFAADGDIHGLLNETNFSFPSGHASFFFALGTVVYLHNKRWGIWFYIGSVVIGLARVMAGAHYATDILAGATLGIAVGWVLHRFFVKRARPLNRF